eukprot:TRINITY_DN943_c0_g1_i1.p1 TRINITY_DN943_c0_g1~~TRINITY_DN943_c0_g1_i1.p1  ORF type:complete len:501 (+),score=96.56 TRINITY_DN943_c0_g1_i1:52-1554(+)
MFLGDDTMTIKRLKITVCEMRKLSKSLTKVGTFVDVVVTGNFFHETESTDVSIDDANPMWNNTFFFELPDDEDFNIEINFKSLNKDMQENTLNTIQFPLKDFQSYQDTDNWYQIETKNIRTSSKRDPMKIRLAITYMENVVLPSKEYAVLHESIVKNRKAFVKLTKSLPNEYHITFSQLMIKVFKELNVKFLLKYVKSLIIEEIEQSNDEATIFRGASLCSKALEILLETFGCDWRNQILRNIIEYDFQGEKMFNFEDDIRTNEAKQYLSSGLDKFFQASSTIPKEIQYLLNVIRRQTDSKFNNPSTTHVAITSFVILRLFSPALLNPKSYGLIKFPPTNQQREDFKVIASFFQKLANLSTFRRGLEGKENLNDILENNFGNMKTFINAISQPVEELTYKKPNFDHKIELVSIDYSFLSRLLMKQRPNEIHLESPLLSTLDNIMYSVYKEVPDYWSKQCDFDQAGEESLLSILQSKDPSIDFNFVDRCGDIEPRRPLSFL